MKVFSEWHQDFTTDSHQHHQYIKRRVSSAKNSFFTFQLKGHPLGFCPLLENYTKSNITSSVDFSQFQEKKY